jgi:hypothetical protein
MMSLAVKIVVIKNEEPLQPHPISALSRIVLHFGFWSTRHVAVPTLM